MCYRNGYGHTCDCCGKSEEPRKMSQREMAQAQAVMEFLKIWNEMISAVKYDDQEQIPFMIAITPGEQKYLDGPALIYAVDDEGDIISLTASDIYLTQQMIENRTMYVEEEDEKMPVLSLN